MKPSENLKDLSRSYIELRITVGWIGALLPFVLLLGGIVIFHVDPIPTSISLYYYTGMRDVMVGALCAVGLFLFFYTGYDKWDNWMGNIAAIFSIGTAFFPAKHDGFPDVIGLMHNIFATLFFLCLSVFSLFLFTRTKGLLTRKKVIRNRIYIICGMVMIACLFTIFVSNAVFHRGKTYLDFWSETVALVAFGVSWLTKGGAVFPDKK